MTKLVLFSSIGALGLAASGIGLGPCSKGDDSSKPAPAKPSPGEVKP
jgi:hypothetical protein